MRQIHLSAWAMLLLAISARFAVGQDERTDAIEAADEKVGAPNGPPFVASLLLIKADWSQSPTAKEIEADLRKALSSEAVPAELMKTLPASGASILFPVETASHYSKEHYGQLLAWLKSNGLVVEIIPFKAERMELQKASSKGSDDGTYTVEVANLMKDVDFLGLSAASAGGNQPFITYQGFLYWAVQNHHSGLTIQRTLSVRQKVRGEN